MRNPLGADRAALDEDDEEDSVELWREVFGEQFPKHVPNDNVKRGNADSAVLGEKDLSDLRAALKREDVGADPSTPSIHIVRGSKRTAPLLHASLWNVYLPVRFQTLGGGTP